MKQKFTLFCCLFFSLLFSSGEMKAQFFNFLPQNSNYLRGEVRSEASGLTFTYRLQDDSTLALSTLLIHTDNNGQALWMKNAGSNFSSYTMAPDSSVILTGGRSTGAGNRIAILQKLDRNGNVIWNKSIAASSADVGIGNIMIGANNTVFATITRSNFSSSTYFTKSAVIAFDMNGVVLWTKYFSNSAQTTEYGFTRTLLAANGDFVGVADVRGSSGASANGMMITRISPQGVVRFSKYIDFKSTHNQLSVTGLVETPSENLVFGGRLMTDQISTYPNTMWLARLDSAGNLAQQKVYSGGERVGEQLHSLRYDNGQIFAYVHLFSPFDSVTKTNWIGTVNEQTLAFTGQNATALEVNSEDPYGNVSNSFCITTDGKPTVAAGFYCVEKDRYFPLMQQWSSTLASSCAALDEVQPLVDSAASYVVANYTPVGSFTLTHANDTTLISLTDATPAVIANLCNGCTSTTPNGITQPSQKQVFRIYPNPGNGQYYIDLAQHIQSAQIIIYNNVGAVIFQSTVQGTHQSIDLSTQAAGMYIVRVRTEDGNVATAKLIKDR